MRMPALASFKPLNVLRPFRSPVWLLAFAAAAVLCLALAIINGLTSELRPNSAWGIGYGIAAATLLAAVAAYSLRRRAPRKGPGTASHWLQFHIYAGVLFLLLMMMHTGFRLPHGVLAWAMWILSIWMVTGGLAGMLIQRWIPRLLTSGLTTEANYQRIPELVEAVREEAESLAGDADASIRRHYRVHLSALMSRPRTRPIFFVDITGGIHPMLRQFEHLRGFLDAEQKKTLDRLIELFKTKTELDAHYTLQKALRWWLYGHVPFSLILIVLVVFHVFSILYY